MATITQPVRISGALPSRAIIRALHEAEPPSSETDIPFGEDGDGILSANARTIAVYAKAVGATVTIKVYGRLRLRESAGSVVDGGWLQLGSDIAPTSGTTSLTVIGESEGAGACNEFKVAWSASGAGESQVGVGIY